MEAFLIYNLKTAVCLAIFYLAYKLLLSKERLHRLNRTMLLATSALSFVLPLCVITVYREVPAPQVVDILPAVAPAIAVPTAEKIDFAAIATVIFLCGAALTLLLTVVSILRVADEIRSGRAFTTPEGKSVVLVDEAVTPFSWFGHIVLSEKDYAECGAIIIAHEEAHIRLHHSWDVLFVNILTCFQWFNPAMWLLRQDLKAVHEYEADERVISSGIDAKTYQLLLIRKAVGAKSYSIANSLNHSTLKNRITMMLKEKSSLRRALKALYVIPLVCLSLTANAQEKTVVTESKGSKSSITIDKLKGQIVTIENDTTEIIVLGDKVKPGDKQPLCIVDGKEVDINSVSPDEIESLTVIKGDSAIELYGTKAKDGVVIITVKNPKPTVLNVNAKGTLTINGKKVTVKDLLVELDDTKGVSVTIVPDRKTPYGVVEDISKELREAGITAIKMGEAK